MDLFYLAMYNDGRHRIIMGLFGSEELAIRACEGSPLWDSRFEWRSWRRDEGVFYAWHRDIHEWFVIQTLYKNTTIEGAWV